MDLEERITFKSPLRFWTNCLTLFGLSLLIILTFMMLGTKHPAVVLFLVPIGFVIFYGFRYLFSAVTTIEIENGSLNITQYNRFLNTSQLLSIPIEMIRGFEINLVSKGSYAFLIYDTSFNYYKYSLFKVADHAKIKTFLKPHLAYLTYDSNPAYPTFLSAFLFAIKKIGIFIGYSLLTVGFLYYLNSAYSLWPVYINYLGAVILGCIGWFFLIRKATKKNNFRFRANYWLVNLFLYLSPLILIPIFDRISIIQETPLQLENCFQLYKVPKAKVFYIKNVSYAPNIFLISRYNIGSRQKNGSYLITHTLATPMESGDSINTNRLYNFWLVLSYKQHLRGGSTFNEKTQLYNEQCRIDFQSSFKQKPIFYTIAEPNRDFKRLLSTLSSRDHQFLALEPHWESVSDMKGQKTTDILLFSALFLVFILIGGINIAVYR